MKDGQFIKLEKLSKPRNEDSLEPEKLTTANDKHLIELEKLLMTKSRLCILFLLLYFFPSSNLVHLV